MVDNMKEEMAFSKGEASEMTLRYIVFRDTPRASDVLISQGLPCESKGNHTFWSLCGFSLKDAARVRAILRNEHEVWLRSKWGVGILFDAFYVETGCYLYVHVCDDARSAELLKDKFSQERDMASYPRALPTSVDFDCTWEWGHVKALLDAVDTVRMLYAHPCEGKILEMGEMMDTLRRLARLAGCTLTLSVLQTTPDACVYDSKARRFLTFGWLWVMQNLSDNREIQVILEQETPEVTPVMCMTLQCQVERLSLTFVELKTYLLSLGERLNIHTTVNSDSESGLLSVTLRGFQKSWMSIPGDMKNGVAWQRDFAQRTKR